MSNDLQPAPSSGPIDPLDVLDGTREKPRPTALTDRLWHFFISMRTGLGLMLGLGVLTLIGTLVKQAPAGIVDDPAAYATWLESVRPDYGGWTSVLDALGFFHMWTSWPFKILMILLTTSILACSVNRAPRLWRHATNPRVHMGESFFAHATLRQEVSAPVDTEQALEDVTAVLRRHHYRVLPAPDDTGGVRNLYAEKFRFGPFGTVLSHVSFVVILLGAFLSATTGFKDTQFTATVGDRVEVGHDSGLAVELKSFQEAYYPDGSPKDYASDLVLYKDGQQVQHATVRVNRPMKQDGVTFYQSFFGFSQVMRIADAQGAVLWDGGVPLVWQSDDGTHTIGEAVLGDSGTTVMVVAPASGEVDPAIKAGQVQVEVYRDGTDAPIATQVLDQGDPTEVAGMTITSQRSAQFTGLIVARDRGALVVWLGSLGLVLGMFMVFFFPHRRIWIRVRPESAGTTRINLASLLRKDVTFESRFRALATDIELAEQRRSDAQK